MIILKRLNVVRQAASEEQAARLEKQGFTRVGGQAEFSAEEESAVLSPEAMEALREALFKQWEERSQVDSGAAVVVPEKGKGGKGVTLKKEERNGTGIDQPDSGNGTEQSETAGGTAAKR